MQKYMRLLLKKAMKIVINYDLGSLMRSKIESEFFILNKFVLAIILLFNSLF